MSIRFGRSGGNYSSSEVMQTENDDWRKIEDVTERRRIQNRLAQRNYRRKLRAKLEELEKKAHSSGSGPGPSVLSPTRAARSQTAASSDSSSSGPATEGIIASPSSPPYGQQLNLSQPIPESSGPFNFDISLDSFLEGVDDMLGPFPVSIGETPRSVDSPNHSRVNHTPVTPITSYETGFTPRSSTSSGFTPAPFGMPMITSYRPPGYLIPPSFSPPPEERPESRRTIDTPNSTNPNYSGSGLASDSPNASIDLNAMTPSSSSSCCSDQDSSSDPGDAGTLTGRAVIYRDDYFQALSKLTLPPGFQELVNPKPTPKQQSFLQQLMTPRQNASIPSDTRFMTLQFNNIFNASILNGIILSFDSVLMLDEDAISPFNDNNQVALSPNIPKDLEPTPMQMAIPHHPYIDIIPFPGFRDRMLRFLDIIDEDDVCCMMHTDWGVWGNRPWDKTSWEVGEKFAEKYWFLMDDEMKKTTDFWRSQRGLKPLRSQQSRKPERGKVVGEV